MIKIGYVSSVRVNDKFCFHGMIVFRPVKLYKLISVIGNGTQYIQYSNS